MTMIAGLGSAHGDDQLGWIAIDLLRPRLPAGISAKKIRGGLELLENLDEYDTAFLIDASSPAGKPGAIRSFTWLCPALDQCILLSSHGLGLVEAIQLAEALGRLPFLVKIFTIEAHDITPGAPLSVDIARQIDVLAERVLRALATKLN
jgi:hydrogenase maturation protease